MINVSILSSFDIEGGAPIAAYRLHKGLREMNQHSVLIVKRKTVRDPDVVPVVVKNLKSRVEEHLFRLMEKQLNDQNRTDITNTYFSPPYLTLDFTNADLIHKADIINLHWVAKFLSPESVSLLLGLGQPVVWTLHDQNPFTGGCHYSAGCEKYQKNCSDCPQIKDNHLQIPFHVLKNKRKLWKKNLTIVTPSRWLAGCAKKSRVFKDFRIEVIPNSLETAVFRPKNIEQAKKELGLAPGSFTLLLGAYTGFEKRKGFKELLDVIRYCLQDERFAKMNHNGDVDLVAFGPPQKELKQLTAGIKSFGYINDNERLATIYSAADIFLLPSREDNLPNTMLEAMACGTPVLSFEVGGMPDMVENGVTGYMAPPFDSKKFGDLVLRLAFNEQERKHMGVNCRRLIEDKFKLKNQAENYLDLFHDLLREAGRVPRDQESNASDITKKRDIVLSEKDFKIPKDFSNLYKKAALELISPKSQLSDRKKHLKNLVSEIIKKWKNNS